jgi:hydrogenase maturation protein HypF
MHRGGEAMQRRIRVAGIVQGVGFRPYVWHLAHELKLTGWVRNDAAGVEVLAIGAPDQLDVFTHRLRLEIPPLAQVRELTWLDSPVDQSLTDFSILESGAGQAATMIGHDTAVCADCLAEMFNPADRRWRYAFINCTHCGPRYTLTRKLPYDRAQTSMAKFPLCPACEREYRDPADRRFHAEPTACPVCGPKLQLVRFGSGGEATPLEATSDPGSDPIAATLAELRAGRIVAIKGLGGFHLACDARNADAVKRLRSRKQRDEKPFAIMAANPLSITPWTLISAPEAELLQSPERPIVLLRKQPDADADFPDIAPGLAWLGVMLPYTPLHWLLFHAAAGEPVGSDWMRQKQDLLLLMTSANPGGEPLVIDNAEAVERLAGIADAVLMHDRDIVVRCDDSVLRITAGGAPQFIRRARGYTPRAIRLPVRLPASGPSVLALGGYLKNTICVTRGDEAFVSQHIGGLDNPATIGMLIEVSRHLLDILQVRPDVIAHDLHPDFFSTRHALQLSAEWKVPAIAVQHHHAHVAAVAAEQGLNEPLLGLALDGIGLGSDGAAWGGELLRLDGALFTRLGRLAPIGLPGGDKAAKEPWRMASSALFQLGRGDQIAKRFAAQPAAAQLQQVLLRNLNCPPTSSLGRWFDAAAGLLGARTVIAYEGQAAMLLEGLAERHGDVAPLRDGYRLHAEAELAELDLLPLLAGIADQPDAAFGAAIFHATLAQALADWVGQAAAEQGLRTIALSGGCFLNHVLTRQLTQLLSQIGLNVLVARQVPPNDGGLSLGQAWVAMQCASSAPHIYLK